MIFVNFGEGPGCGGELFNYAGSFASPGYPNNDRNQTDCNWIVTVPNKLRVALQFEGMHSVLKF